MNTELNIAHFENSEFRDKLVELSNSASKQILTNWAFQLSKHAYEECEIRYEDIPFVIEGYLTLTLWLDNKAQLSDLRREFFQIEKFRRMYNQSALVYRALAQSAACAVGSPTITGKSLASSDYAIKAIWEHFNHDMDKVNEERIYQMELLNKLIENN